MCVRSAASGGCAPSAPVTYLIAEGLTMHSNLSFAVDASRCQGDRQPGAALDVSVRARPQRHREPRESML